MLNRGHTFSLGRKAKSLVSGTRAEEIYFASYSADVGSGLSLSKCVWVLFNRLF